MLKLLFIVIVLIGISFVGLAITILLKKGGKFPETEIGHNKKMRELGIHCAKSEEYRCRYNLKEGNGCAGCHSSN